MESVEGNVLQLLEGRSLDDELLCDFTLSDQNEATGDNIIINNIRTLFPEAIGNTFCTFQVDRDHTPVLYFNATMSNLCILLIIYSSSSFFFLELF